MPSPHLAPSLRQATFACLSVLATSLTCAALVCVASLLPTPPVALAIVVVVCTVGPLASAYRLPASIAVLRVHLGHATGRRAATRLRAQLDRLPETDHPLGL